MANITYYENGDKELVGYFKMKTQVFGCWDKNGDYDC